jgi:uncharacterized protein
MRATLNREIVTTAMEALAKGDSGPFYAAMADDCVWRPMGTGWWATAYEGKATARDKLFRPLWEQYAERHTNTASHILADGDVVIVECQGRVTLKSGQPYNNRYCFVIEMADGKMREVREYFDTALSDARLRPPAA